MYYRLNSADFDTWFRSEAFEHHPNR